MEPDRHFWVLDPRILDYVKFAQLTGWQVALFIGAVLALCAYFLLVILMDRRVRARERRKRQLERLDRWLRAWALSSAELDALREMVGSDEPIDLYRMLSDPIRFEIHIHDGHQSGRPIAFTERLRNLLGYQSTNLSVPVVSTRQVQIGEHFRFLVWGGGRPRHYYGQVAKVDSHGLMVELTDDGFQAVREGESETDMFYLRPNDLEYQFPVAIQSMDTSRRRFFLAHRLVRKGHRPRSTRLPIVRPVTFRIRTELAQENHDEEAANLELVPALAVRGVLLEMSEGGFSLLLDEQFESGAYVSFTLPRPRGRTLPIMGRVLSVQPYGGTRWLLRCELRGLPPSSRNLVAQLLHLEQQRRLRRDQQELRRFRQSV